MIPGLANDGPSAGNGRRSADPRIAAAPPLKPTLRDASDDAARHPIRDGVGLLRDARILVVDDCTVLRDYLVAVLASHGAASPGAAWDLVTLIAAFEVAPPQIILLNTRTHDSAMLLRQALKLGPNVRLVVLGLSEQDELEIVSYAEAGAAGYHLRNESLDDLLVLIHQVAAGGSMCSPRVSAILLRRLSSLASQRRPAARDLVLTAREIQILRMLEMGLTNRDIAERLRIAIHTVKNHVHSLLTKLGVSTRAQAAAHARTILSAEEHRGN